MIAPTAPTLDSGVAHQFEYGTATPMYSETMSNIAPQGELYHAPSFYSADFLQIEKIREKLRKFDKISSVFQKRLTARDQEIWAGINEDFIRVVAQGMGAAMYLLSNPTKMSIDITSDRSIFFTSVYKNKNVYAELFIDEESLKGLDLNFNIMKEGELVSSGGGETQSTFMKLMQQII